MKANPIFPAEKILARLIVSLCIGVSAPLALAAPAAAAMVSGLPDFTELVDRAGPAVVNIRTTEKLLSGAGEVSSDDAQMQEFFRRFFGVPMPKQAPAPRGRKPAPEEEVPRGVGSGFILSADGYVLTNAHVVEGASEVYVKLTDKREFKAKVIGSDKRTDVAVLKIEASKLPKVTIGDSDKIRAGEWVIAIGSPFELDNTVTAGIVSAKARDTGDFLPLIQTDVAVNPGNSGGPLINMRGEVVGINSQIYSRSGGYMGISFAIPIDEAMRVADQLKASGKVTRGRIGVQIGEVSKEVAESLGLPKAQGAVIARIEAGSPAEKAGLQDGDVILKLNGAAIEKSGDLPRIVGAIAPGAKASITVWRKGAVRELPITVAEMEADKPVPKPGDKKNKKEPDNLLGLAVTDLNEAQKKELQSGGVVIENVDGPAAAVGLKAGDVILMLNNVSIKDAKQFNAMLAKLDAKKAAALLVKRGDISQFILLKPQAQ
ncbi:MULTISPECIES: DegQ family serine endoprotease [unclassified Undibacterium]|uniref:DegQ family serine endoprotease n=1 Tax=unclassified Undibacterium TaxID=2630295 RepID=UPI002AC988E5|nr:MULTISPECIES: DegQ family serine endoprotease [unclassified Undibacterium]MEB0138579.1 DegQ family serine endoprotease [Undibacterium sp. CCC2.1]MEB0171357.1 DegQ family serine endoprotease [Undibacterium sp. CCC1.1]MEB0175343.1 DegQ family serine endoprotease [Undibacterium sp. CCC3.4]MEB0214553.1 DegQ family serine endoprotease [Undibacterium sp. 5I2]WPX43073.1 DegQ family serine endoprotease [Undibacterium sp. CCC3.4]